MQFHLATVVLATLVALASAQRFAGPNPNTVDEYDYEDAGAQAPVRPQPQPRSYAPNQARLSATQPKPTPIPILKQINRHNDDGSYTYGYEGADGSFKIETKLVTGEVMGKYGYVDDSGKVRVVEYGANKYGFQPAGEGITVAPPTLVDETRVPKAGRAGGLSAASLNAAAPSIESQEDIYDDSQYYEEPATAAPRPAPARALRPQPAPRPRAQTPQYLENSFSAPAGRPSAIPNNFAQFTQTTSFGTAPGLAAAHALPSPRFAASPVPARAQIAGAVPAGPAYRPVNPAPVSEPSQPQQALFVPQSQLPGLGQHYSPAAPAPLPRRPAPSQGGGLLDQLARDYALPQGAGTPLVDTSFGVY
ncbi:translation initiation factor IF-2-like [Thrips palmi]|uniref:Translation initiation factor IF-2-like n=1 Tax=Thrips palmi TaxID=161013 RepID=A0A6P8ZTW2_THRPL|nr:translation initiation factor IF-2-like [Thrips palmi]